jgi:putative holliday junction resolvase
LIPAEGRVVGFDLGSARIGVAISDSHQRVASALDFVAVTGDVAANRRTLSRLVAEEEAVGVVVGLPLSLDGSVGPAARAVLDEIDALTPLLGGLAVETVDERFTTVAAHQALRAGGRRGSKARQRVDSAAATLLLQSWLDRRLGAASSDAAVSNAASSNAASSKAASSRAGASDGSDR